MIHIGSAAIRDPNNPRDSFRGRVYSSYYGKSRRRERQPFNLLKSMRTQFECIVRNELAFIMGTKASNI